MQPLENAEEQMEGKRVVILGAGGHAKVVCDALRLSRYQVVGFLDDDPALANTRLAGLSVLGAINLIAGMDVDGVIVGIGNNAARRLVFSRLDALDMQIVNAIHPQAVISDGASLGKGVAAFANVVINPGTVIGDDVILNTASTIDHDCIIGDHAHVAPGAHVCGGVHIGEGVLVGSGAVIVNGSSGAPIVIGDGAIIGAGACVIRSVAAGLTVVGVPAAPLVRRS